MARSQGAVLERYHGQRDFHRSPESRGRRRAALAKPIFVIQKHASSTLHYDFRIEAGGVLKSWAVPKGPSMNPRDKRLAVPTEDHPMEYAAFEGVIPEGQYGAGTVMVWDSGIMESMKKDAHGRQIPLAEQIESGHATFRLDGMKLKGGFALIRSGKGKQERWFLIKMADDEADPIYNPVNSEPDSVLTDRSLEEIARGGNSIRLRKGLA
jgi:DNA ligase D-like protein (predicted 3'-phosphoesterase)